ncbi:MAG: FtsX-like permease family protein [Bacteroidota bacterium]
MLKEIYNAFGLAIRSLRTNLFQTLLSVLGIVIGVGALVTMLCMIDGMENLARREISAKTSLENIAIIPRTATNVDGMLTRRDKVAELDFDFAQRLIEELKTPAKYQLLFQEKFLTNHPVTDSVMGVQTMALSLPLMEEDAAEIAHGRMLTEADQTDSSAVMVINHKMAVRLVEGDSSRIADAIGMEVRLDDTLTATVVGINAPPEEKDRFLQAAIPLTARMAIGPAEVQIDPQLILAFDNVEEVAAAYDQIEGWLPAQFPEIENPVRIIASTDWLKELESGFLIFRILMGLIVGIAVVVGGIGVMNVTLMSIKERTAEIGIRKAVGAKRKNIMALFLSESIAVSMLGSLLGLILGVLVAMAVGPILSIFLPEGAPDFQAAYTLQTLITVVIIAIIVGIVFGTYPARKAAKLDPVTAIARV